MAFKNFVTPHCHVASLDSASTPDAFVKKELELDTGTITTTDHGSLGACRTVYDLGRKNGLIPILGLEGYVRDDQDSILLASGIRPNDKGTLADYCKYFHLTTHFRDQKAYNCAVKLLSNAPVERHGQESKPLFSWKDLEELAGHNVTVGSSCLIGICQRHLLDHNDPVMATKFFERLLYTFGKEKLLIEVFPHRCTSNFVKGVFISLNENGRQIELKFYDGKKLKTNVGEITAEDLARVWGKNSKHTQLLAIKDRSAWIDRDPADILQVRRLEDFVDNECTAMAPDGDVQKPCNEFVRQLGIKHRIPILVSGDEHFAYPEDKAVQDVRLMASGGSWRFANSYHRQSSIEAYDYFKNEMNISEKEFEGWVENSHAWAQKFKNFEFKTSPSLPRKFFPKDGIGYTQELIQKHGRMDWQDPVYVERLGKEIDLLHNNGTIDLLPYFFNTERVCALYEKNGLLIGPGRGSASGLLLAYLLGITHVDPIENGLSMERFITLDRVKSGALPDIDSDFPSRDLLLGDRDTITQTITFEAEDGTIHTVPENTLVDTTMGSMKLAEAFEQQIDFKQWWISENQADTAR